MITNLINTTNGGSAEAVEILAYPESRDARGFFNSPATNAEKNIRLAEDLVVNAAPVYNPEEKAPSTTDSGRENAYSIAISDEALQKSLSTRNTFSKEPAATTETQVKPPPTSYASKKYGPYSISGANTSFASNSPDTNSPDTNSSITPQTSTINRWA